MQEEKEAEGHVRGSVGGTATFGPIGSVQH